MKRRESLKAIAAGTLAAGTLAVGCNTPENKSTTATGDKPLEGDSLKVDRYPEELAYEKTVIAKGKFFTAEELATVTLLADIIIPKDDISGSASDAKVPEFIDFMMMDDPSQQIPMRGGLRWLDMFCLKKYNKAFKDLDDQKRIEVVDLIAYPEKAKNNPELSQGVSFFSLMRNFTASGFYTSEIGVKDVGYAGNKPTQWNGVPDDVLKQYGLAYTPKELEECIKFDA